MLKPTLTPNKTTDTIYLHIPMGQSNQVSFAELGRLQNPSYNYVGISTGYPAIRSGQPQYAAKPTGGFIYYKGNDRTADPSADNGLWQAYEGGVNISTSSPPSPAFDSNLSLIYNATLKTGKEHFIIKPAFPGVALTPTVDSRPPSYPIPNLASTFNFGTRFIASKFFIERGIRDLRLFRPNAKIVLVEVSWWQGENDGNPGSISADVYTQQFNQFKKYIDDVLKANLVITTPYIWNIVRIYFANNAAENLIRTAQQNIVSANPDCRLINIDGYKRKFDLSAAEAAPIAVGSPNSVGGTDDIHSSYITQLSVGEIRHANIVAAGLY